MLNLSSPRINLSFSIEELFYLALKINDIFIHKYNEEIIKNVNLFLNYNNTNYVKRQNVKIKCLVNTLYLIHPIISTTFVEKMFKGVGAEELGMIVIDEAGQASPYNAIGSIYRGEKIISLGDPCKLNP
ncbi:MAG: hypothetical protein LBD41_07635 [Clostridiales Family XIII bacterium]|nr:hypothetical protein [Clostridiales Family XIII bacterium]